jgi:hypothetical protein
MDLLAAQCAALVRCGDMHSQSTCITVLLPTLATNVRRFLPAVHDARAVLDAAKISSCVSQLNAGTTCDMALLASCTSPRMYDGQVGLGSVCYWDDDCQQGYCDSNVTAMVCPGSCRAKKPLGAAALGSSECDSGYEYNQVCATPVAAGYSCAPVSPSIYSRRCADGLYCHNDTCVPFVPVGGACLGFAGCAGFGVCLSSGVCSAPLSLNSPCQWDGDCQADLTCSDAPGSGFVNPDGGSRQHCMTRSGMVGAACYASSTCLPGLFCSFVTNTCKVPSGLGGSCADNGVYDSSENCAPDLQCTGQTTASSGVPSFVCVDRFDAGHACSYDGDCVPDTYCLLSGGSMGVCTPMFCKDPTP